MKLSAHSVTRDFWENSLAAGLPAHVLSGAVGCELFTLPAATAYARQNPAALKRCQALLAAADVAPPISYE